MSVTLVTGAGGFIGSHLVEKLCANGKKVRAFVHYNSRNHWGWLENAAALPGLEVVTGDIRDFDSVDKAAQGVEEIYHLGALIGIPYSYSSPLAYVKTNMEGTYNVLEAARRSSSVKKVLVTSTSEVYGSALYVPIDEKHPYQPQSPYSASKIAADQLALSYYNSFKLPVVVARPFNTFGPRQSARAVIPTIITQLLTQPDQLKLGNLDPKRDFTYVEDTVSGLIAICHEPSFYGRCVNIGTGTEISIRKLIEMIGSIVGVKPALLQEAERVRPATSEVNRLLSDNRLLSEKTGWSPSHDMRRGLEKTVDWLKQNLPMYKPNIFNV